MPCILWYLWNGQDLEYILSEALGDSDESIQASSDWDVMDDFLSEHCSDKKVIRSYKSINDAYEASIDKVHEKMDDNNLSTHEMYCHIMLKLLYKIFTPEPVNGKAPLAHEYYEYWKSQQED